MATWRTYHYDQSCSPTPTLIVVDVWNSANRKLATARTQFLGGGEYGTRLNWGSVKDKVGITFTSPALSALIFEGINGEKDGSLPVVFTPVPTQPLQVGGLPRPSTVWNVQDLSRAVLAADNWLPIEKRGVLLLLEEYTTLETRVLVSGMTPEFAEVLELKRSLLASLRIEPPGLQAQTVSWR